MLNIIFFGPPGSGKGTQSKLLSVKLNFIHLCAGDILRYIIQNFSYERKRMEFLVNKGKLVSNNVINNIMKKTILNYMNINKNVSGFIYDGYPRSVCQAAYLDNILSNYSIGKINLAFYLSINTKLIFKRIFIRSKILFRKDDSKDSSIQNRIDVYKNNIDGLLDFYSKRKCLYKINADQDILKISNDIYNIVQFNLY